MKKKALRQILRILWAVSAAANVGVKRIPIGSIKLSQCGLTLLRLILGGGQNDTPMRRTEPRRFSVHGAVFLVHPKPPAGILNLGREIGLSQWAESAPTGRRCRFPVIRSRFASFLEALTEGVTSQADVRRLFDRPTIQKRVRGYEVWFYEIRVYNPFKEFPNIHG